MANNDILQVFGTTTAFTVTVASLATSASGVGRQATLITNTSPGVPGAFIGVKIKLGTSPTANTAVFVYAIRGDGTIRDDGAGASDAAWTRKSAELIGVLFAGSAPATGDVLQGIFYLANPGKEFGVGISHNTGVNLDSTGGNHTVEYTLDNPQVQ